ncbi:hypothetical protein [Nocardioides pantholopis]|uniref:hypothetical protein n=1 Tax=Nocardioides pantholopis TaxID=2483798 RepID=UPI0013DDBDA5|nr:hypothetical protein [Nocardioides pantholopis]
MALGLGLGTTLLTTVGSVGLGGVVATATIIGVVSSQTAAPEPSESPARSSVIEYGSNS